MTEDAASELDNWSAPQIGLLAEFMTAQPFAPVAKAWLPRRSQAGTFDTDWESDRHPRMPLDYQLGFWNAAPLRLQIADYLRGDETIAVTGMSRDRPWVDSQLPGAMLALRSEVTGETTPMVLDAVDIDLAAIDDGMVTVTLMWRAMLADRDAYQAAQIVRGTP